MAFDNATRNRLSKFVAGCREMLVKEFTSQLTRDFGLDPDTGEVTDVDSLTLNNVTYETAIVLRETMQHYMAVSNAKKKDAPKEALQRIVREQSFTVLNRLCALRMAERRDLFIESVGKGIQSDGFQLYSRVAGTSLGPTGDTYRAYLFSVFDELAVDLPVLFDRFSAQGRLFPRDTVLQELLEELNHAEIEHLWEEDETIGWIYQYFNDPAERKKMRDASQAPRNSRELAVRNQFFTPRYVVEFLTDNTLGRIWYEMRKGDTCLVDECQYLVRRPNEIFEGEEGGGQKAAGGDQGAVGGGQTAEGGEENTQDPPSAISPPPSDQNPPSAISPPPSDSDLTQEELLNQPVHIPHRPLKDPREIRMLDPACGSMHFGLYAFDLYLKIYEEAWDLQVAQLDGSWRKAEGGKDGTQLQRSNLLAGGDESGGPDLSGDQAVSQAGALRTDQSNSKSSGVSALEHRGRTGAEQPGGVPEISGDSTRLSEGSGDSSDGRTSAGLSDRGDGIGTPCPRREDGTFDPGIAQQVLEDYGWVTGGRMQKADGGRQNGGASAIRHPPSADSGEAEGGRRYDEGGTSTPALCPLPSAYSTREAFLKAVPKLIIEHNIHGIDIDPRAVQIAGLSLWLRAQREWKGQGIAAGDRPQVTRSNIVCAEPMPGDEQQLAAFCQELHPAIAQMVTAIFEEMRLAGEAGSLLRIEQEIKTLVAAAHKQWRTTPRETQMQLFGGADVVKERQLEFDLSGITDQQFFEQAEETIYEALRKYASETSEGGFRRKLFAGDAEKGFAFVNVVRNRYEAVLMNPPFGLAPDKGFEYARSHFPASYTELLATFVERGAELACGRVGAITSRSFMVASRLKKWREKTVIPTFALLADLGDSVMDGAFVEAAAYVLDIAGSEEARAYDCRDSENPKVDLLAGVRSEPQTDSYLLDPTVFSKIPNNRIVYSLDTSLSRLLHSPTRFEPVAGTARQGLATWDDFRFVRLWWEIPSEIVGRNCDWEFLGKGGAFSRYLPNVHLLMKWRNNGAESRAINIAKNGSDAQARQASDYWRRPGLTYSIRSQKGFSARLLPRDCLFTGQGPLIVTESDYSNLYILGWANSKLITSLIEVQSNDGKFMSGLVKSIPWMHPSDDDLPKLEASVSQACRSLLRVDSFRESSPYFAGFPVADSLDAVVEMQNDDQKSAIDHGNTCDSEWNSHINELYGISDRKLQSLRDQIDFGGTDAGIGFAAATIEQVCKECVSYLAGIVLGRWDLRRQIEHYQPFSDDLFRPLTARPANALITASGHTVPIDYDQQLAVEIAASDSSDAGDLASLMRTAISKIWDSGSKIEEELCTGLGVSSLNRFVDNPNGFFASHYDRYSMSRREAPIYWPISTESGSYTLWLYYHRLTDQTLYKAVNDFVDPKLKQTTRQLADLRAIKDRTSSQEKELAQLTELESELEQFKADLLEIAAFWKPNLNDGVQITAAPLWKFFRLTKWRNKLKKTWSELESGKYDWAHLALSIWPDRVVREKCTTDRSIAIAHDLEEQLWHEVEVVKVSRGGREAKKMEWQPRELSNAELNEIVKGVRGE